MFYCAHGRNKRVHYQEMQGKQVWMQSSTGAIALDNVEVPDTAMLGEANEGFKVMVTTLNGGRLVDRCPVPGVTGLCLDNVAPMRRNVFSSTANPSVVFSACKTFCSTWILPWNKG